MKRINETTIALDDSQVFEIRNLKLQRRVCELEIERHQLRMKLLERAESDIANAICEQFDQQSGDLQIDLEQRRAVLRTSGATD